MTEPIAKWNGLVQWLKRRAFRVSFLKCPKMFIFIYALPKKEKWVFYTVLAGLFIWFIINSGFHLYLGIQIKVVINAVYLLSICIPMLLLRKNYGHY